MFLLDTNVVSELGRTGGARNVARWVDTIPRNEMFLSVITLAEMETGVQRMERRDHQQGAQLRRWLDGRVLPYFAGRVLPVDQEIARCCARLSAPSPLPAFDSLIAATAIMHRLTVATRDISDFARMGAPLFNPWEFGAA